MPLIWAEKGFLSLKPLSSWTQDLTDRITFLSNWIKDGTPIVFWVSGRFFGVIGRVLFPAGVYDRDFVKLREKEGNCD